jgi:gluconolactonase
MERTRSGWTLQRVTYDTAGPRAIALSADEKTLYVADGDTTARLRELRAYPILQDGTLAQPAVLHTFGSDHRGAHRGIEGMCIDAEGNIIACAVGKSGPGALVPVFSPLERYWKRSRRRAAMRSFGDADLSLYHHGRRPSLPRAGHRSARRRVR